MIFYEGFRSYMARIGVRDRNWEFVRNGAIVACYEFTFRRAEEKGCQTVNLSRARPFLNVKSFPVQEIMVVHHIGSGESQVSTARCLGLAWYTNVSR